jgi:hypothetical protein
VIISRIHQAPYSALAGSLLFIFLVLSWACRLILAIIPAKQAGQ